MIPWSIGRITEVVFGWSKTYVSQLDVTAMSRAVVTQHGYLTPPCSHSPIKFLQPSIADNRHHTRITCIFVRFIRHWQFPDIFEVAWHFAFYKSQWFKLLMMSMLQANSNITLSLGTLLPAVSVVLNVSVPPGMALQYSPVLSALRCCVAHSLRWCLEGLQLPTFQN